MGALPESGQMVFKALQTYSDGTIVRWIDEPTTDGTEPEKPAPVLKLAAATDPAAETSAAAAPAAAAEEADGDDGGSSGWGIAGLVVAIAALVLGLLAYRRAGETEA
jgi:hypothetical protein